MFKNLTPEERKKKLQELKSQTTTEIERTNADHQKFINNIQHATLDLNRGNQELEDINTKLAGKGAKKGGCEII
ncbi:hypothetical protein H6P87_01210 [Rickettsia tillamookensis]|uniref:Uncharacterized protein n=1 Tax=Rickettsia tillamookensis TaxID=2761623 RepID=A0A9E6MIC2_9RICK|nr:hypothetical protein [Rickettsia tillamookensis]QQV75647.1 hypothetical protein H6P87_01210 [Rickettsia tillamookensis]